MAQSLNILIDTHILIWSIFEIQKLPVKLFKILEDSANQIFVSKISLWEISLKFGLGKLNLGKFTPEDILGCIQKMNFTLTSLNEKVILSYHKLKVLQDPFDKMLIWESIQNGQLLMTLDKQIIQLQLPGLRLITS